MSHSPEQNRKKAEAKTEAQYHKDRNVVGQFPSGQDILNAASTQYQNENPDMSSEKAFNEVAKVSPEVLKRDYKQNKDGSYTHK